MESATVSDAEDLVFIYKGITSIYSYCHWLETTMTFPYHIRTSLVLHRVRLFVEEQTPVPSGDSSPPDQQPLTESKERNTGKRGDKQPPPAVPENCCTTRKVLKVIKSHC